MDNGFRAELTTCNQFYGCLCCYISKPMPNRIF